jgi:hypothetical protein
MLNQILRSLSGCNALQADATHTAQQVSRWATSGSAAIDLGDRSDTKEVVMASCFPLAAIHLCDLDRFTTASSCCFQIRVLENDSRLSGTNRLRND